MGERLEVDEAGWRTRLEPDEFRVLRQHGTERAFTGTYHDHHGDGTYRCAGCGAPLFKSADKYDSGSGWPSFHSAIERGRVVTHVDQSLGMTRVEVRCARCEGHLGHVFDDGPAPTGKRYCINSIALDFQPRQAQASTATSPAGQPAPAAPTAPNSATDLDPHGPRELATATSAEAVFAGGCFWCMEAPFERLPGVTSVEAGYAGGRERSPSYAQVSGGRTGHAEVVRVRYDPSQVSYARLLQVFLHNIDPTQADGQFCDRGPQYRSDIFVRSGAERAAAEDALREAHRRLERPIQTRVSQATTFWPAEDDHQDFHRRNADRYQAYRQGCGRDARLRELWGEDAGH